MCLLRAYDRSRAGTRPEQSSSLECLIQFETSRLAGRVLFLTVSCSSGYNVGSSIFLPLSARLLTISISLVVYIYQHSCAILKTLLPTFVRKTPLPTFVRNHEKPVTNIRAFNDARFVSRNARSTSHEFW